LYKVNKLNNGMDLIFVKRDSMRSASVMFCIKAGSVHEENENAGAAHFIEHIAFRKTKNRNIIEIKKPIEEAGGSINAFTSKNLTVFYSKIPTLELDTAINILSDISFNASLEEDDIEKEKKIVLEEIAMYDDDPIDITFENLFKNIYDEDFARPVLGFKETVLNFDKKILNNYYSKYYVPNNTVAVVVGGFDDEKVINLFENIKINSNTMKNNFKSPILKKENILVKKSKKELSQNYIINAFEAPSKNSNLYYATLILNTIFGSGMSSLLFTKIREEEALVYEVASEYNAYLNSGLFLIFAATSSENLDTYNKKLDELINNFHKREDLNEWFNYGKKRLIGKLTIDIESNIALGMNALESYLTNDRIVTIDETINKIMEVTIEDVVDSAKYIFSNYKYRSFLNPGK